MGVALAVPIIGTVIARIIHAIFSSPPPSSNMTVAAIENHNKILNVEKEARERAEKELGEKTELLEKGIQPTKWPTADELRAVKEKLQYQDGHFHFAVTGGAGCGKSSLINAFRGMRNKDERAAKTGVVETTSEIGRYHDPDSQPPRQWTIWYDVPGAGTSKIPDWQYFNNQGLFIFDLIILVTDIRFTKIDLEILQNCQRFKIPTFIVRSKANQHIRNIQDDMSYDSDDEDGQNSSKNYLKARDKYITETHNSLASNLKEAGLPPQEVYIVSKDPLCTLIKGGKESKEVIDEKKLIRDLVSAAYHRRYSS